MSAAVEMLLLRNLVRSVLLSYKGNEHFWGDLRYVLMWKRSVFTLCVRTQCPVFHVLTSIIKQTLC